MSSDKNKTLRELNFIYRSNLLVMSIIKLIKTTNKMVSRQSDEEQEYRQLFLGGVCESSSPAVKWA